MLVNYLKIACRYLWKNKFFSIINILGLSLGMAAALLIIFHVGEEISYDKGFARADKIFRVTEEDIGNSTRHWAATPPPMGPSIQRYFPEIVTSVRFHRPYPYQVFSATSSNGQVKRFQETGGFFADPGVIDVFDLQFIRGNPKTALSEINTIILTEEMARKYFGDEDPVGKTIQDDNPKLPLTITGVIRNFSFRTHLRFDYLLSMATISRYQDQQSLENRGWSGFYTYVLLKSTASARAVESRFPEFMVDFYGPLGETREEILSSRKMHLQPISDIHLHSKLEKEMYPNSDITYVYIFSIAALFILLVAAVNFVNILTSQAFRRMKEIGLRKVVGATKSQLIRQFLVESFLITLLATLIALVLCKGAIPGYEHLTSTRLRPEQIFTFSNVGMLLLLTVFIGLLAGSYPAWFVARFNPSTSLQGKKVTGSSVNIIRKGLIVFQFVVSVFMVFSTIIIYRQLQLFHNKDLGFDKQQLVAITMYGDMWKNFGALINDIKGNTAISGFSVASTLPGERFSSQKFTPLGVSEKDQLPGIRTMWADDGLLSTLQISLKTGRNFFSQFPDIKKPEFLLNEAAVKAFHLEDPVGRLVVLEGDTGEVVGVIKDFNFASLHSLVEPLVIQYNPYRANYLLLKVPGNNLPQTLRFMESRIKVLAPSSAFTYTFIDDKLNLLYESENRMSLVFKIFAALAIFISSLGLFGLSAYAAQLRIKEVGIRKVLGASTFNVALLLSKDFMSLVLVAILLSWPIAWWAMSHWLDGFAYRTDINFWVFTISGAFALFVAVLTVSFQAIKAALLNPATTLKNE